MINFDLVEANIHLGSAPNTQEDIARLKQLKVSALICLQSDQDLASRNVYWPQLCGWYESSKIAYSRFPMQDFNEQDLANNIEPVVVELNQYLQAGHSVYVHCNSGIFRAPTAVLGYLCVVQKMSVEEAMRQLRIARPVVSPSKKAVDYLLTK